VLLGKPIAALCAHYPPELPNRTLPPQELVQSGALACEPDLLVLPVIMANAGV